MLREAYLMKKCDHEGLLKCLNVYETKKTFELVVEFANVGEWLNTVRFTPSCEHKIVVQNADIGAMLCR
eukprot:COSAG02_NODE_1386_length_12941_cov_32.080128_6_plen_69_part_00